MYNDGDAQTLDKEQTPLADRATNNAGQYVRHGTFARRQRSSVQLPFQHISLDEKIPCCRGWFHLQAAIIPNLSQEGKMLLSLPPEVLISVFDHLLYSIGIRRSVHLRRVCHSFDRYVLNAVYALPTFENVNDNGNPDHLRWEIKMSKTLVAGLIRAKLKNHQEERALTREILSTLRFITKTFDNVQTEVYADILSCLTADSLPLYEIIRGLSRDSNTLNRGSDPLENALLATLRLNQSSRVETLLNLGAKARWRTKWFGDALCTAASYTETNTFLSVLRKTLTTNDRLGQRLAASRLVVALECAATHGKAEIFCEELWTIAQGTYDRCSLHKVLEPALKSATLACHNSVVLSIFDLSSGDAGNVLEASENTYWIEVLRMAASNGVETVVRWILSNTAAAKGHESLGLPLEDACRTGHRKIVELLLDCHTGDLHSYAGAAYWAAREAHYDILNLVFQRMAQDGTPRFEHALCGASKRGASGMTAVLQIAAGYAPMMQNVEKNGETYLQTIDHLFKVIGPDQLGSDTDSPCSPLPEIFLDMLSAEVIEARRACNVGDFSAMYRLASHEEVYSHAGAFSASIRHQNPGILQFLCEKFPTRRYLISEAASGVWSAATFQVMLDHGWLVDVVPSRSRPPILGSMTSSEELTRWFLDYGADVNVRSDWDITPLSIAIDRGSLSIIRLLLRHGADARRGQLLHLAMERAALDQLAVIDMLYSYGLSLSGRMFEDDPPSWVENRSYGMGTPLHKAAELGNGEAVAYLLERGANALVLDSLGRTAIDVARAKNNSKIADMIEKAPGSTL